MPPPGSGNLLPPASGGLPMMSEIVRSKANIDNGAKTHLSNFFHGLFLLASLALIPGLLQKIPLAALAGMLIYTGFRLASPKEFVHVYKIGAEQLFLFVSTMLITLATDLLIGVGVGLIFKMALHLKNGARLSTMFKAVVREERNGDELTLYVHEAAIFTNYLGLKTRLLAVDESVKTVVLNFENAWVIHHTGLEKLHGIERSWSDRKLILVGLDDHESLSTHQLAVRRKARPAVAS